MGVSGAKCSLRRKRPGVCSPRCFAFGEPWTKRLQGAGGHLQAVPIPETPVHLPQNPGALSASSGCVSARPRRSCWLWRLYRLAHGVHPCVGCWGRGIQLPQEGIQSTLKTVNSAESPPVSHLRESWKEGATCVTAAGPVSLFCPPLAAIAGCSNKAQNPQAT